jgi:transposase
VEKKLTEMVSQLQQAHSQAKVEVWAQDEARLGLQPIIRRVWTPRGQRPIAVCTHKRKWLYVYSFVHPASGRSEWMLLPVVRTAVMNVALAEFAQAVGAGRHKQIVLVWDNASWHTSGDLVVPDGIHLLPLPASTPELQPAERVWPLVREAVANTPFATLDPLEERLAQRCRALVEQPDLICQVTHYHWWPTC